MENWLKSLIVGAFLAILGWLAISYLGVLNYIAVNDEFHKRILEYVELDRRKVDDNRQNYEVRCDAMEQRVSRLEEWVRAYERDKSNRNSLRGD